MTEINKMLEGIHAYIKLIDLLEAKGVTALRVSKDESISLDGHVVVVPASYEKIVEDALREVYKRRLAQ